MKLTLWHIPISHYSEKARWALDFKGLEYERRAPLVGYHMAVALVLTRGRSYTFPVLDIDGERIGDSTAIIAALERRCPQPALYPADPGERARALALEDYFDEQVGPYVRRFGFHEMQRDRALFARVAAAEAPPPLDRLPPWATAAYARAYTGLRYVAGSERASERARSGVLAALDRLEAELDGREYLVGDSFTVADLTAAALLYPLVQPPEGPRQLPVPQTLAEIRRSLMGRPAMQWVLDTYRRHRRRSLQAEREASTQLA